MIKVSIALENSKYQHIEIKGHAMYDDFGKDIVCSAVSSIVTTTINGILLLAKDSLKYKVDEGSVIINYISNDEVTQTLIKNMFNMLKELETSYPDNIQVK